MGWRDEVDFSVLKEKILEFVEVNNDKDLVRFITKDGKKYQMYEF